MATTAASINHYKMNDVFVTSLWKNFAAAIDMLKDIVTICPDETWQKEKFFFT